MSTATTTMVSETARKRRIAPVLTLVFLAPFIAEVLSGATRMSAIFALVPEMMIWGCGALLARELVRRWGGGWPSLLMFGLALSIAEEFVVQQTSLAPLPFPGALANYGRLWGVNWIYFLFMLGYESVWVVLVPVQVTELLFPERRNETWLRTRGMIISAVLFLLGSWTAWYAWIRRMRPMIFHVPVYTPALLTIMAGLAAIVLLGVEAYLLRRIGRVVAGRSAPPAWVVGVAALVLGFPWYWLMELQFSPQSTHPPFWIPLAVCGAWALLAYALFRRWTSSPAWSDLRRWAGAFATTVVCMVAGFLGSSSWLRVDVIGKAGLNIAAIAGFLWLLGRIRQRSVV
ncbi:MAG TPA: hypothetical protein VHX60_06830 [Acidobacteriaceae bacterium]|jgi:hypothetical protein|nr:hypothetical protein [Acidobacteriaceae bacterium]